jgi:hypothetical protein
MLKLTVLDIVDEIYYWIEDWLKDRRQRVILLGANSDWITGFSLGTIVISDLHKQHRDKWFTELCR